MKRIFTRIPFLMAVPLLTFSLLKAPGASAAPETFTGEVTDTFCAQNGSHNEMMAKMSSMGRDKETCVKQCMKIGAKYVLYDPAQKKVYKLEDQAQAEGFVGKRVRVSGTLEGDAIKIANIKAVA